MVSPPAPPPACARASYSYYDDYLYGAPGRSGTAEVGVVRTARAELVVVASA